MTILQSILLGILQGIAEFLPISSSGHLSVVQSLFKLDDVPLLYDIFLHLSTLLAVVIFFRKKIARLLCCFGRWISRKPQNESTIDETDLISGTDEIGRKSIIAIIAASFVTGVIGIFTSKIIPDLSVKITCIGFLITSFLLIFSSRIEKTNLSKQDANSPSPKKAISLKQSLFIGLMQGIGTLPGISRSGSTIAGAQIVKVDRTTAGEFSFIVSIPAILGAFLLELKDLGEMSSSVGIAQLIAGCVSSFVFGYFALAFLMKLIKKGKLEWFATYLIPVGILGIIFL